MPKIQQNIVSYKKCAIVVQKIAIL